MSNHDISEQVRGKTIRLTWNDGPTKGAVHEHRFHDDGTVEWRTVPKNENGSIRPTSRGRPERPPYVAERITDEVCLVSYLSGAGYTLTMALHFPVGTVVGIASNEEHWMPVHGRFEAVNSPLESVEMPSR